jgi:hypothetical protein
MRAFHRVVGVAVVALLATVSAQAASDPALKCGQAVLRGAAKLAHTRLVSLRKCEDAKRTGKSLPSAVCRDDAAVAALFAKATAKLTAAVDRVCGGADKRCGGADDVTLAAMQWPNVCPDLEGSGCAAPLASCADVPACVACLADAAVSRGLALVYAPFTLADRRRRRRSSAARRRSDRRGDARRSTSRPTRAVSRGGSPGSTPEPVRFPATARRRRSSRRRARRPRPRCARPAAAPTSAAGARPTCA